MELTLHTEFVINSAHRLVGYEGKCSQLHGHSWRIEVWFRGNSNEKDKIGILIDFGVVKQLEDILDHRDLNDIIGVNPTAENLCEWIYDFLTKITCNKNVGVKVKVYETSLGKETWCEGGDF